MKSTQAALPLLLVALLAIPVFGIAQSEKQTGAKTDESAKSSSVIEYISPKGIKVAPHFSPAIKSSGQKTIYVSGMTG